jgi:hypothetical protein
MTCNGARARSTGNLITVFVENNKAMLTALSLRACCASRGSYGTITTLTVGIDVGSSRRASGLVWCSAASLLSSSPI